MSRPFDGSFDLLPLACSLYFAPVPLFPIEGDFELAVSQAFHTEDGSFEHAAARWRVEAIRWRRQHAGKPLNLDAIAKATAGHLYREAVAS